MEGILDNSKCSFYSATQTLNSSDNRPKDTVQKKIVIMMRKQNILSALIVQHSH